MNLHCQALPRREVMDISQVRKWMTLLRVTTDGDEMNIVSEQECAIRCSNVQSPSFSYSVRPPAGKRHSALLRPGSLSRRMQWRGRLEPTDHQRRHVAATPKQAVRSGRHI